MSPLMRMIACLLSEAVLICILHRKNTIFSNMLHLYEILDHFNNSYWRIRIVRSADLFFRIKSRSYIAGMYSYSFCGKMYCVIFIDGGNFIFHWFLMSKMGKRAYHHVSHTYSFLEEDGRLPILRKAAAYVF